VNPLLALGLLAALTLLNVALNHSGVQGAWLIPMTLALVWAKGLVIVEHFMQLRVAPPLWRGLVHGWLLLVCAGIAVVAP